MGAVNDNRLLWLGLAIGVAGFGWGAATHPGALAPMWTVDSWMWLGVLALGAVVAAIAESRAKHPALVAPALGAALVLAAFGVVAFAAVALILLSGFALGACLLEPTQDRLSASGSPDIFSSTIVGLAAWSLGLGLLAHSPYNVPLVYLVLSALAISAGWRHVRGAWDKAAAALLGASRSGTPLATRLALWIGFGIHLYFAALPERYHDALAMHLVIARALALFGSWHFDAVEYAWAVQPMGANWLFGWAYVLAEEPAAKLLNAMFLLLLCGLVVESRLLARNLALFAIVILVLTPLAFIESGSLFVENALAMFTVAAMLFAARGSATPSPAATVGLAIAAAGAMAVKLQGVIAVGALALALLIVEGWRNFLPRDRRSWIICLFALLAALWPYAYAWWATGNPVFPLFNGVFKSPLAAPTNFDNFIYAKGLSLMDFVNLTFGSGKYLEGSDGAGGFAIPLLLPAGLLLLARAGSRPLRLVALAAMIYIVGILLNIRYLRYLYPVFPVIALILVYPLAVTRSAPARIAVIALAVVGIAFGFVRIPAAGWILYGIDLPLAFSPRDKEQLADAQVPARRIGHIQAAMGSNDSRVAIFGQSMGAYVRGRPLYTTRYFPKFAAMVASVSSADAAAMDLAALGVTHVIFDRAMQQPEWTPWRDAATSFGRRIARTGPVELYEFRPDTVPLIGVIGPPEAPWQGWAVSLPSDSHAAGLELPLAPDFIAVKAMDVTSLPDGVSITLSTRQQCDGSGFVESQIDWQGPDESLLSTDGLRSACRESASIASVSSAKPKNARVAYFYFINAGAAVAHLDDPRAEFTRYRADRG